MNNGYLNAFTDVSNQNATYDSPTLPSLLELVEEKEWTPNINRTNKSSTQSLKYRASGSKHL